MPKAIRPFLMLTIILLGGVASNAEAIRPFDGKQFHGRIAYSSDGNFNDPDDWAASPMSLALIAAAGLQEKLVHFHYNSILWASEAIWERRHQEAVLQAAERFGFDKSRFFDCRQQPKETVAALAREVEKSTQADPLYVILAGPVDVILAALKRAPEQSRRWVYVISHSRWNEGFRGGSEEPASGQYHGIVIGHTKRDVIALGVRWVQIPDQNLTLCAAPYVRATALGYPTHSRWAPAPKEAFAPYFWLRDSADANFHLLWTWLEISTRPDPSDAGMTYFLLTGDPVASPEKIQHYLSTPAARSPRDRDVIRLEAENFALLENYRPATTDRQMSHALGLLPMLPVGQARLQTIFDEPYIAEKAVYDLFFAYVAPANEMFITTVLASGREVSSVEKKATGTGVEEVGLGPVVLTRGDSLEIQLEGTLPQLDYVELRRTDASGELPTSERIAQKARSVPQPASSVTKP
ncbi:MAG: hypothetical protein NZ899_15005, partial [Thermoguttaceae bacterium]|nr:hypothetical protein [Thermoguttaceae bacterium]